MFVILLCIPASSSVSFSTVATEPNKIFQVWSEVQHGMVLSLLIILTLCLIQIQTVLSLWTAATHCCLMLNLWSIRIPRSFLQVLLLCQLPPIFYLCIRFFLPKWRTLHFSPLNNIVLNRAKCSKLSRSLWKMSFSSRVLAIVTALSVVWTNFLFAHPSHLGIWRYMKNSARPRTELFGIHYLPPPYGC